MAPAPRRQHRHPRAVLSVGAAASMLLRSSSASVALVPTSPPAADPCPLEAPDGGYTSFVAWTATFNAQPHHVASPFKRDLVPPILMPEICSADQWSSQSWAYLGMRGSDWLATPMTASPVQFIRGGEACSQKLTAVGVFTAIEAHASLRLHFEGCDRPSSVLALRLTNDTRPSTGTGEPTVMGVGLLDWMCHLSPKECQAAKAAAVKADTSAVNNLELAKGKVGVGRCTGYGVEPHPVIDPAPTTASGCASECQQRIARNLADPSQGSCRGYAWSEHLLSCIVYDGWPVTGTDDSWSTDGYFCDNMTAVTLETPTPQPAATQSLLGLAKIFDNPRAITARRIQVSPFKVGCFSNFDWYMIDRWINVPSHDFAVLAEMTRTNQTDEKYLFSHPSHGGHAPRSNLIVERACLRDCSGALRAECKAQEGMQAPPPGFAASPDGRLVAQESAQATGESSAFNMTTLLAGIVGGTAAERFTDQEFLPWAAAAAALTSTLGFVLTLLLSTVYHKYLATRPTYHQVEEVKLIYEGEEEETLVANMATGGVMATWQPSKCNASSSMFSSIRAPFGTR
mmetsp:Transcript_127381/g.317969  ORF Transcript_127381/g.317969 Transcript_127381/m.317969 type:complete len:570 (-) Transcript_127381:40-1749(-)